MAEQELINEFIQLEALGQQLVERAYKARVQLERFNAPAPTGVKKKKVISDTEKKRFIEKFRKSLIRKK